MRLIAALLIYAVPVLAQNANRLLAFGDSITEGYAATAPEKRYVSLIAQAKGLTLENHGISGQQATDQADWIFGAVPQAGDRVTYMIGTNDNLTYGLDPGGMAIFRSAHLDEIAWLAIPEQAKTRGTAASVSYSGTWSATGIGNGGYGLGKTSTNQGDSARFQITGTELLIGTIVADGNGGRFSLSVDGTNYGEYRCYGDGLIATKYFKRTYAPSLIRLSKLSAGSHSVAITVTSASGPRNNVYFEWAAGLDGSLPGGSASVYAGELPRDGNYAAEEPTTWDYSAMVAQNVSLLQALGLRISFVPVAGYIDPLLDLAPDLIHPNDLGHARLAQAFLDAMDAKPLDPLAPRVSNAGITDVFTNRFATLIPGEIVSIFGINLGGAASAVASFDPVSLTLPTSLGGASVKIAGIDAPLYFVSQTQINAQVPYEIAGLPYADLVVTYNGKPSSAYKLAVADASVHFFPKIFNADGSINSPTNPARPGDVVVAYATGQGLTNPRSKTGKAAVGLYPPPELPVSATLASLPARILFSGQAPFTAGLMQLNIQISSSQPPGDNQPLEFAINGAPSIQTIDGLPVMMAAMVSVR